VAPTALLETITRRSLIELVIAEAQLLESAGLEVREQDVGPADQLLEQLGAFGCS
jgi:hypothetical protein